MGEEEGKKKRRRREWRRRASGGTSCQGRGEAAGVSLAPLSVEPIRQYKTTFAFPHSPLTGKGGLEEPNHEGGGGGGGRGLSYSLSTETG